jgi:hypothetical protein
LGQDEGMLAPILLITVPLALLSALLFGMSWFEQRVLSPQSLIAHAARSRRTRPEHVERLVALESERLLAGAAFRRAPRAG